MLNKVLLSAAMLLGLGQSGCLTSYDSPTPSSVHENNQVSNESPVVKPVLPADSTSLWMQYGDPALIAARVAEEGPLEVSSQRGLGAAINEPFDQLHGNGRSLGQPGSESHGGGHQLFMRYDPVHITDSKRLGRVEKFTGQGQFQRFADTEDSGQKKQAAVCREPRDPEMVNGKPGFIGCDPEIGHGSAVEAAPHSRPVHRGDIGLIQPLYGFR